MTPARNPADVQLSMDQSSGLKVRVAIALIIFALVGLKYCASITTNPVTGEKQAIALNMEQEIAMGLQSAPEMARQMGGVSRDAKAAALVSRVGRAIVAALPEGYPKYPFEFHLLADRTTVNAFALPGGQVFITEALLSQLETEGQLAGVLGHEIGHVFGRHSAERIAKGELMQGIVMGTSVATSDGRGHSAGGVAQMASQFLLLKYGRGDELESDELGLKFMAMAGYDPRAMVGVMKILERATGGGGAGGRQPEWASTHPNPGNRIQRIQDILARTYPGGVPAGFRP